MNLMKNNVTHVSWMNFDIIVGGNKVLVKKQVVYFFIKIKNCFCN